MKEKSAIEICTAKLSAVRLAAKLIELLAINENHALGSLFS
jgi:hypothetical protein